MQKTGTERDQSERDDVQGSSVHSTLSLLNRPFKVIAFDWDGTAVANRRADATAVREVIERLLDLGVYVVVVTGTNFKNVDNQLSSAIHGLHKRRLFALTNRGSEVFGFADDSHPVVLWRRLASADEERLLTRIADRLRDEVAQRTGLKFAVVYDRLNRRKVDVIPEPEWADPPKSRIGDLLQAVESRLVSGGLAGGLREAFQLMRQIAVEEGLPDARITSDVKHLEVGLTDKEDSVRWLMQELARRASIQATDILIGGDEFGPIAGFEGSDYLMYSPLARGASFVSVGPEPNGVPPGVLHLGGGPARFLELLNEQAALHAERAGAVQYRPSGRALRARADGGLHYPAELDVAPGWVWREEGYEPSREHEVESLLTVGNGYVGVRGSLAEGLRESRPATLIAGVFDKPANEVTELVVQPDWTRLRVFVEDEEIRLYQGETLMHRRLLDLRRGTLRREWRHRDSAGRVTLLRYARFVSLADQHAWVESVTIMPENYSATLAVENMLDGRVINTTHGIKHLEILPPLATECPAIPLDGHDASPPLVLRARTRQSGIEIAYAGTGILCSEPPVAAEHAVALMEDSVGERWQWEARLGTAYRFDKLLAVATSRDTPEPLEQATANLAALVAAGAPAAAEAHDAAWRRRWEETDTRLPGHEADQTALRFAMHHLIQSANPNDEHVSIGARGLTGEAYQGHVFWDTEIFVTPFFTFTHPSSARAQLMYRYHTLAGARGKARQMGYRGALYAWESADTGEEVTPPLTMGAGGEIIPVLTGEQEHHISADVAYAAWQYWRATGDDDFFRRAGAEILLDTARFWSSRVQQGEDGLYHIRRVIGPDEYHEGVDDNAFTNVMAQWNLERGLEVAALLRRDQTQLWLELCSRLGLTEGELATWRAVADRLYTGFDPATGLFEQFRGYYSLEQVDLTQFEPRNASMEVLIGRERLQESQVIKQSDVVMLMYLLWDRFPAAVREANFRFYAPRCAHGSSLSPSIHAAVAARLGDLPLARHFFRQAAAIDLGNNMGNAAGGVHTACQGGLWQSLVFGFGGLTTKEDGLAFDPHPLPEWGKVEYTVSWRGRRLLVRAAAAPRSLEVTLLAGDRVDVSLGEDTHTVVTLEPGRRYASVREGDAWRPLLEVGR